jgi:hypothetical protein
MLPQRVFRRFSRPKLAPWWVLSQDFAATILVTAKINKIFYGATMYKLRRTSIQNLSLLFFSFFVRRKLEQKTQNHKTTKPKQTPLFRFNQGDANNCRVGVLLVGVA